MIYALMAVLFASGEVLLLAHLMQLYSPLLLLGAYYACTSTMTLGRRCLNADARADQSWRKHRRTLTYYIAGGALGNALWFASLWLMGASSVALLSMVQRVALMIYSARHMNEPMSAWQWVISVTMIVLAGAFSAEGDAKDWLGVGLCSVSYLCFCFSDVAQKRLSAHVPWTTALTARQIVQFALFGGAAAIYCWTVPTAVSTYGLLDFWLGVVAAALMGGVLSKICHYHAVTRLPLNRVVLIEQLESVLVFFLGVALFSQVTLWSSQGAAGVGMVLCLVAFLWLERRGPAAH
jgi:drug/metabolite transporter (DMT)-like permease